MSRLDVPKQLSPHLFVVYAEYPHRDSANVYLITGRTPVLIDCGSRRSAPHVMQNLATLGLDIADVHAVIATHGDCDHTQGFHQLHDANPNLRLHLHPADLSLVQDDNPYRNAAYLYPIAFHPIAPGLCKSLADGDRIPAGDGELVAMHTPGHTEGSTCLWGEVDGHRVLFAGDTIGGSMRSLEGADLAIWAQAARTWQMSLERVAALEIDWILNGHEPVTGLPLTAQWLKRAIGGFGDMMNPWFFMYEGSGEEEPVSAVLEAPPPGYQ